MSEKTNNPSRTFVKRAQSRFIQIDEKCINNFGLHTMSIYQQLRLLTDFTKDCDEIEITVPSLAKLSKVSERQAYKSLNELEFTHQVIQRLNYHHIRFGKINSYNVARDYGFFQNEQDLHNKTPVDNIVQKPSYTAHSAGTTAHSAGTTAHSAYLNKQNSSNNLFHKKQNKGETPVAVSVFSNSCFVKTHIEMVVANRNVCVDDDVIDQGIYYAFETNNDHTFDSVNKRINIFLKKVREGKWLIPQGYKGITSQSIREKEEKHEKEKQEQYKQDAKIGRAIKTAVAKGQRISPMELIYGNKKG